MITRGRICQPSRLPPSTGEVCWSRPLLDTGAPMLRPTRRPSPHRRWRSPPARSAAQSPSRPARHRPTPLSPFRPLALPARQPHPHRLAAARDPGTGSSAPTIGSSATLDPDDPRAARPGDDPLREPVARSRCPISGSSSSRTSADPPASPRSSTSRRSSSSAPPSTSPARDSRAGSSSRASASASRR